MNTTAPAKVRKTGSNGCLNRPFQFRHLRQKNTVDFDFNVCAEPRHRPMVPLLEIRVCCDSDRAKVRRALEDALTILDESFARYA